jgi:hypothetical protein
MTWRRECGSHRRRPLDATTAMAVVVGREQPTAGGKGAPDALAQAQQQAQQQQMRPGEAPPFCSLQQAERIEWRTLPKPPLQLIFEVETSVLRWLSDTLR